MSSTAMYVPGPETLALSRPVAHNGPERRRAARISLHWNVSLTGRGARACRGKTRDISPNGFYCVLNQMVQAGEELECDIAMPAFNRRGVDEVAYLRCKTRILRLEKIPDSGCFGVACRIEDYRIIRVQTRDLPAVQDLWLASGDAQPSADVLRHE